LQRPQAPPHSSVLACGALARFVEDDGGFGLGGRHAANLTTVVNRPGRVARCP
jgi:hypothetical protein